MMVNDQMILEEDYDENYEPTENGNYACCHFVCLVHNFSKTLWNKACEIVYNLLIKGC